VRAVVTGAARGLGEAVAARLAAGGASVALIDISPEVTATAERIAAGLAPGAAGRTTGIVADVADEAACEAAIGRAAEVLGGIDALVNNAGIGGPDTPVVDTAFADFWSVLRVNLGSAFLASRAAARLMIARRAGGAIVNLGSIFGQQGVAGGAGYCASKAAVALLTQSLALELAPHGIRVNTIAPGNAQARWKKPEHESERSPLGRPTTGQDIGHAVAFLLSDEASHITGSCLDVSGGTTLH
jgi:NAD(P)-dependent dehydrogenase (short-subunit alcohol dehydrogenase family)